MDDSKENNLNNENKVIVIVKYSSYTESQKRAIQKYRQNNKEKVNELHRKYYNQQKDNPEFIQRKREQAKKYYYKKKEQLQNEQLQNEQLQNEK